jgi:hypothetical protein
MTPDQLKIRDLEAEFDTAGEIIDEIEDIMTGGRAAESKVHMAKALIARYRARYDCEPDPAEVAAEEKADRAYEEAYDRKHFVGP